MTRDPNILVVDLDGSLLKSDMLHESFWSAFSGNWRTPFIAAGALRQGRANLKARLTEMAQPQIDSLPYNEDVIARIEAWRAQGGQAVLATATDQRLADQIAAHLGIFDAVYGSDAQTNLKGDAKAALLEQHYGPNGFVYVGDSRADLQVWKRAGGAISVNAPEPLRREVEGMLEGAEHIGTPPALGRAHWKALRPHQWLKNMLVFLPMIAGHQLDMATLLACLVAFISFSLVASGVYVINDLLDLASDRAHPRKCARPFASGAVPLQHGLVMAAGLFGFGVLIAALAGPLFVLVLLVYIALTTAYSLLLKRLAIIDICVLAALYTVRIVAGGAAAGITLSVWLLALSMFLFLSLAAVKRLAELSGTKPGAAAHGRDYRAEDLPFVTMVALAAGMVSVLIAALYLNSDAVRLLYTTPELLWTICVVLLYWILRVVMIAHRGEMHDDPVVFAVKDRISHVCGALIFAAAFLGTLQGG